SGRLGAGAIRGVVAGRRTFGEALPTGNRFDQLLDVLAERGGELALTDAFLLLPVREGHQPPGSDQNQSHRSGDQCSTTSTGHGSPPLSWAARQGRSAPSVAALGGRIPSRIDGHN